jgi:predicted nucleic acid-binding protein
MGSRYLIDSNIIIKVAARSIISQQSKDFLKPILDKELNLSIISKLELLSKDDNLIEIVNVANIFHLNEEIINETIRMRRKYKIRLPDAIIAATAIVYNFELITHNTKDFQNIKNLKILNPIT